MKRPEIIVDLDGVVYPWAEVMAEYIGTYQGVDIGDGTYSQWSVWEDWGIPEGEFMRYWRMAIEDEVIYAQGPPIPGAREALWYLSDTEFHITLATSRLNRFGLHQKVVENTIKWLREACIPYRSLAFIENKKILGARYGIDDKPSNVQDMKHAGIQAYLFSAPHNQEVEEMDRVNSWSEFVEQIEGVDDDE